MEIGFNSPPTRYINSAFLAAIGTMFCLASCGRCEFATWAERGAREIEEQGSIAMTALGLSVEVPFGPRSMKPMVDSSLRTRVGTVQKEVRDHDHKVLEFWSDERPKD